MAKKKKPTKTSDRLSKLKDYNSRDFEKMSKEEREEYKALLMQRTDADS